MAIRCSSYMYVIILTCIHVAGSRADVVVSLKMLNPLLNTRFYVICDIMISADQQDMSVYGFPVQFEDSNLACSVMDWRYCNNPAPVQTHGVCGCSSKTLTVTGNTEYVFYLLIDPVTSIYIGSQFTCGVQTVKDTRQMDVVTFSRQPAKVIYACKNTTVHFDWEFDPIREFVVNTFRVAHVNWRGMGIGGTILDLGAYYISADGRVRFENDNNDRTVVTFENSVLPQLLLKNVLHSDNKMIIKINVTFNVTKTRERVTRVQDVIDYSEVESSSETTVTTNVSSMILKETLTYNNTIMNDSTTTTITDPSRTATSSSFGSSTVAAEFSAGAATKAATSNIDAPTMPMDSMSDTPETTPDSTILEKVVVQPSTTPSPVTLTLARPENSLVDSVQLVVTEPPSPETRLDIKAVDSVTGNLVITCQALHMSKSGEPPVNITIWRDQKRLTTRSGIKTLHYSTPPDGKSISCSLEGHALDCLPPTDPRVSRETIFISDIERSMKPVKAVDLLLSLYAWESIICLVLMLWALSLLLDHIQLVLRRAKTNLEESNREVLEQERKRLSRAEFSTHAETPTEQSKNKRRDQRAVTKYGRRPYNRSRGDKAYESEDVSEYSENSSTG